MRKIIYSAFATAFILIGSFFVGASLGAMVNDRLPGHPTDLINILLSAIPALAGVIAGGAVWGWALSRITLVGEPKRMIRAGAFGFGPTVILVALALTYFENLIVEQGKGPQLPIHNVFTLLFTPAATVIAGVGTWAVARGARVTKDVQVGVLCALASGIAFLIVNLAVDAFYFRVGAPGAVERFTMLVTVLAGNFSAALVGGGVIGAGLKKN